ncbi:MAG: hypothetical protein ACXVAY_12915 [Mucilaginibacter sp.]
MTKEETIEFAKLLVQQIRDSAIRSCDVQLYTDNLKSPTANRWRKAENEGNKKQFGEMIISDSVDSTIFFFLQAIDDGLLHISFNASNGKTIEVAGDIIGELSGWYMGEWISKYTNERFIDDFPDIG